MNNEEVCTEMIRRILPDMDIRKVKIIQAQKSERETFDTRGVRFDIFSKFDNRKLAVCEAQTMNKKDLARRSHAYQIALGLKALSSDILVKSGNYNNLPDTFVIFICTFDPFGYGRHIYTFYNTCKEESGLNLNDGAYTIFLNARGILDDISKELRAFLDFFMTGKTSEEDSFIKKLYIAKQNADWRSKYMLLLMREQELIGEGRTEGRAEGRTEGRNEMFNSFVSSMKARGMTQEEINQITNSALGKISFTQ